MDQNLFWAFIYNTVGIPLAAGCFIKLFGWTLNPMFGAAAMSLSSFCVVSNALRLNLFRLRDARHDHPRRKRVKPAEADTTRHYTLSIEGMMCHHCEMAVQSALEALPGVISAQADHEQGIARVEAEGPLDEAAVRAAITEADYELKGMRPA